MLNKERYEALHKFFVPGGLLRASKQQGSRDHLKKPLYIGNVSVSLLFLVSFCGALSLQGNDIVSIGPR